MTAAEPQLTSAASAPPSDSHVGLAQTLSWIAFGACLDNRELLELVENDAGSLRQLEDAARLFSKIASDDRIRVRGRKVSRFHDNDEAALADTVDIAPNSFRDFTQVDLTIWGLRRRPAGGETLEWRGNGDASFSRNFASFVESESGVPGPLSDGYRDVEVRGEDLLREFPPSTPQPPSQAEIVAWCRTVMATGITNMNDAWAEFRQVPIFRGLSRDDVLRPAWREAKAKR